MKKATLLLVTIAMIASYSLKAQVAVTTDGSSADASAMLEVKSTTKGFLPPRMTSSERDAISSPVNGLTIYNITTGCMNFYLDGTWVEICSGTGTPASDYAIGTGGSCANSTVNGAYIEGIAFDEYNTVTLDATVTTSGPWSITTNTVNGYSFSGNGTFVSTGTVQVTLLGTGIPTTAQTDNFTATANGSGGTCTFSVTVVVEPTCGDPIIYDGQSYTTVVIGAQCWMVENLNIGTRIDGDVPQTENSTIEKYCYGNIPANCDTYGGLYQWDEMMQYIEDEGTNGICPPGWHLPTDAEYTTLSTGLGGNSVAGGKMKETGTTHWSDPNVGATNSSGFTGIPGGRGYSGGFGYYEYAYFWSSSISGSSAGRWYLRSSNDDLYHYYDSQSNANSVRCIRSY